MTKEDELALKIGFRTDQTRGTFQVQGFSFCPDHLLSKVLFVVPLINSVITFMEANLWQNVPNVERK
jgi:hypothetical protein